MGSEKGPVFVTATEFLTNIELKSPSMTSLDKKQIQTNQMTNSKRTKMSHEKSTRSDEININSFVHENANTDIHPPKFPLETLHRDEVTETRIAKKSGSGLGATLNLLRFTGVLKS